MSNFKCSVPNILTLTNLSLGVIAILLAVKPESNANSLFHASLLVLLAAFTDRFDGKVARMLEVSSEFGKELDSLSDLISFGVAPIIIAWKISLSSIGLPGYLVSLIFPMAGAYRLARYNSTEFDSFFRGIPITIAGAFLSINNLYDWFAGVSGYLTFIHTLVTIFLVILLSILMISNIKIKKI